MMNSKMFGAFAAVAVIALIVHFFIFELRYAWYLSADNALFIRIGYGVFLLAIALAWCFYPSRILVAVAGTAAFVFPPVLRSEVFASMTPDFLPYILLSILLLLCATELRRRAFQRGLAMK